MSTIGETNPEELRPDGFTLFDLAVQIKKAIHSHSKYRSTDIRIEEVGSHTGQLQLIITADVKISSKKPKPKNHYYELMVLGYLKDTGQDLTVAEVTQALFPEGDSDMKTKVGNALYRLRKNGMITSSGNKRNRKWCYNFGTIRVRK